MIKKTFLQVLILVIVLSCSSDSNNDTNNNQNQVTLSDFTISIDENPTNGQVLGTVNATTNQGSINFMLSDQVPNNALSINSNTGELSVANESLFDFETHQTILATINASSGNVTESASIVITINDVYEPIIFHGDVLLKTQQEVNEFGSFNYTEIDGDLTLEGINGGDISDLTPLSSLQIIHEDLYIARNSDLIDLTGLESITTIKFRLVLQDNPSLTNVDGLSSLENIGSMGFHAGEPPSKMEGAGGIEIIDCNSLISLEGFSNITVLRGSIGLGRNNGLTDLHGLHNIENILGTISIGSNDKLINLDGLSRLQEIGYSLFISENASLQNINGLNQLTRATELAITLNQSLTNIDGLENFESVEYFLHVYSNSSLSDLCGLQLLLANDGVGSDCLIHTNQYNPSKEDIIAGNCSL